MKSTLCLSYCSRPTMPLSLNFPSTLSIIQKTKHCSNHSSFWPGSGLNFSRRPLGNVFNNPVICAVEKPSRPSEEEKGNCKFVKGIGASFVLAFAVGVISCSSKLNLKAFAGPKEMFQKAPPTSVHPIGGSLALKSFLDVSVELTSSSSKAKPLHQPIFTTPPGPSMEDVKDVKLEAVRIIKAGNPEEAVKMLQDLYDKCQNEPEPAYNIEMALVEILIYQGRYEEALNCNCLKDELRIPSDGRFPLYKAIIYTMLNKEEATKWWEEFAESLKENPGNF